jgi:hypothetical protein
MRSFGLQKLCFLEESVLDQQAHMPAMAVCCPQGIVVVCAMQRTRQILLVC